nr:hypothetical protein SYMBAF_180030 [Serratia symbiotica]CDS57069.1 hypothetical protein SYMBAF_190049 [Serratia symbiotica]CDS57128.1 hypothetical protein SYMBAF_190110 [Serratia symbiotica]
MLAWYTPDKRVAVSFLSKLMQAGTIENFVLRMDFEYRNMLILQYEQRRSLGSHKSSF